MQPRTKPLMNGHSGGLPQESWARCGVTSANSVIFDHKTTPHLLSCPLLPDNCVVPDRSLTISHSFPTSSVYKATNPATSFNSQFSTRLSNMSADTAPPQPLEKVDSAISGLSSSPPEEKKGHRRASSSAAGVYNINDLGRWMSIFAKIPASSSWVCDGTRG